MYIYTLHLILRQGMKSERKYGYPINLIFPGVKKIDFIKIRNKVDKEYEIARLKKEIDRLESEIDKASGKIS